MSKRKLYWDTTCFICFLNRKEQERRLICQDVIYAAKNGEIEIWTSTFTIVEVIRPRRSNPRVPPLPEWARESQGLFPKSAKQIEEIWEYYKKNTAPYEKLTKEQVSKIAEMFEWPWIKLIILDERIANKAVSIARDYDLKPADSVHAASAILKKVDAIQRWDKDFSKVKSLIAEEEPSKISLQHDLIHDHRALGPHPDDFEPKKD
jgi:predicted nucleic acid-binding protein